MFKRFTALQYAVCTVRHNDNEQSIFQTPKNEKFVAIISLPCWRRYGFAIGSSLCSEKERNLVRNPTNVHKLPFCDVLLVYLNS